MRNITVFLLFSSLVYVYCCPGFCKCSRFSEIVTCRDESLIESVPEKYKNYILRLRGVKNVKVVAIWLNCVHAAKVKIRFFLLCLCLKIVRVLFDFIVKSIINWWMLCEKRRQEHARARTRHKK